MYLLGPTTIEYDNGDKIHIQIPYIKLKGMTMGDKLAHYLGVVKFTDERNKLKACIKMSTVVKTGTFSKRKRQDEFQGKLYRFNP